MLQAVLILLLFTPVITNSQREWSYNNTKLWSRTNRYCGGKLQSPINLRFDVSYYDRRLEQLSLHERYPRKSAELFNNGHTAQISLQDQYVVRNVAPASEDYKVEQVHFHWGHSNDNKNGSEHFLEGQSYPLEMHIVSYSSLYPNMSDAMANTRALAVIGVFFELANEPNPLLQPLVDALAHIRAPDGRIHINEQFRLQDLIGEERLDRYYRYDGSLTTPPCYESVIWSVLLDPIPLSLPQLHAFRYLHDHEAKLIKNTHRAVQPLGTRLLFRNFLSENIDEDLEQRMTMLYNRGRDSSNNIKLMILLISLLISIF